MANSFKKLEKNALGCMYIATLVGSVTVMAILTAIAIGTDIIKYGYVQIIYGVILVFALINCAVSPYFRYNRYRYKLDEEAVEIIEGYIFVKHSIVPIERIQNIVINQGPIDKMFGVSKMAVTTGGGEVELRFVSKAMVDIMSDSLKKKVNEVAVMETEEA